MKINYTTLLYLMMGGWLVGGTALFIVLSIAFSDEIALAIMLAVFLIYGYAFTRVQKKAALEKEQIEDREPET